MFALNRLFPRPRLNDLLGFTLLVCLLLTGSSIAGDPGVGWHLVVGRIISESGEFIRSDPFLFTSNSKPWVYEQWLADLIQWQLYLVGGAPLLHLLAIGCCIWTYVVILPRFLFKFSTSSVSVFLLTFLGASAANIHWILRPVVISFLFFTVVYIKTYLWCINSQDIDKQELKGQYSGIWILPLIFLIWANTHGAFIFGLFILLISIFGTFILPNFKRGERSRLPLMVITFVSLLATFFNPYGIKLYSSLFALAGSKYFMSLNVEWLSPDYYALCMVPFLFILIALLLLVMRRNAESVNVIDWSLLIFFLYQSLLHRRCIPFFVIVALLPMLKLWQQKMNQKNEFMMALATADRSISNKERNSPYGYYTGLLTFCLGIIVVVKGALPYRTASDSGFDENMPTNAVHFILTNATEGSRIFHTPNWGGYLIWKLWPRYKAFIDDRNGLNPVELYEEYFEMNLVYPRWKELLNKYNFDWILLADDVPLATVLKVNAAWNLVFEDKKEKTLVYRRSQV